jgi:hypothetical protein
MTCGPSSENAITATLFEGAFPHGPGIYSVEQRALTSNDPNFNWTSQYRIDLLVVPEPAASLLGVAALVTLVAVWLVRSPGHGWNADPSW